MPEFTQRALKESILNVQNFINKEVGGRERTLHFCMKKGRRG